MVIVNSRPTRCRPNQGRGGWAWRLIVIALAAALVVYAVLKLELLFVVLFVAVALTAILVPLRRLIERTGLNRGLSTAATLILSIALIVGIFSLLGRALAGQANEIATAFTQGVDDVRTWLREGPLQLSDSRINDYLEQGTQAISDNQGELLSGAIGFTSTAVEVVTGAFLVLFTTIFFLYDGRGIWDWFVNLFPRRAHESMHEASALGWASLTGYVRGTAIIALVDAVLIGIGIAIVGVPLALPLGVIVFFGAFIPIVGALIAGFIAVAVALAPRGGSRADRLGIIIASSSWKGTSCSRGHGQACQGTLGVVLAVTAGSLCWGSGAVVAFRSSRSRPLSWLLRQSRASPQRRPRSSRGTIHRTERSHGSGLPTSQARRDCPGGRQPERPWTSRGTRWRPPGTSAAAARRSAR